MLRSVVRLGAACAALFLTGAAQAAPISSGFSISFLATPGAATGDVVAAGGAVFTGAGSFGAGAQSVVRIDGGGTTVLAQGFNSLGGFAYDAANDRLLVGDNAGDLPGAVTGDTLYAIPNPFGTPGTPASAQSLELLPSGSIPGFADLLLDPADASGNALFLTDASASFPPAGRLLAVDLAGASALPLHPLAFAAGLAADASVLYVGEALLDFSGQVSSVALAFPGDPLAPLASLAGGLFDLEIAADGSLLATSGGSILRIDPSDGSTSELASGFGFATGLFADPSGALYALDGFAAPGEANRVWVLTPIPEPATAAVLGLGLGLLGAGRRLRLHSASRSRREKRTGTVMRP